VEHSLARASKPEIALRVEDGPLAGKEFPVRASGITLGRIEADEVEVGLGLAGVSAVHARVYWDDDVDSWCLEDLGSRNGTQVDGDGPVSVAALRIGSIIQMGNAEVRVVPAARAGAQQAVPVVVRPVVTASLSPPPTSAPSVGPLLDYLADGAGRGLTYLDRLDGAVADLQRAAAGRDPDGLHRAVVAQVGPGGALLDTVADFRQIFEDVEALVRKIRAELRT
jgi:hypothetical protein